MSDRAHTQPLAAPFVEGLQQGLVRYQHCEQCGHAQTLARHACARCGQAALVWRNASGLGQVYALTVVERAPSPDFAPLLPYTLVLVQLDEGPRLMGHACAGMAMAQRVRAQFFVHRGQTLLRFAPLPGNDEPLSSRHCQHTPTGAQP